MSQPVHILQLLASLSTGGAERLVLNLAERLDPARFKVHVLALSALNGNPMQAQFDRLGVPVRVLGARKMYDPRVALRIARIVREWRINLIHTHLINPDILGRVVGRSLGLPVVSTLHNIPQEYEREVPYRYWPERLTAHLLASRMIAVSERIREMYIERWRLSPGSIMTIVNGVPLDRFLSVAPGSPADADGSGPLVTTIGRLTPQKGQRQLLDAAQLVLKHRPDARFLIVGEGKLHAELLQRAAVLGISDQVIFAGVRHDIPEILGESDLFVLSSLWEGMPVSAIEAMAAARPVVLTDVGGVRDLVTDGLDGLVVPPDDPPALAAALLSLLNSPRHRQEMAAAARARVQQEFSMELFIQRHEQLYSELLARAHPIGRRGSPTLHS